MSDEEFSGYTKLSNELCKNSNLLRDVDGLPANDAMLENILFSFSPVHLRLGDNKVLKHAMSLRHQNFNDFLNLSKI